MRTGSCKREQMIFQRERAAMGAITLKGVMGSQQNNFMAVLIPEFIQLLNYILFCFACTLRLSVRFCEWEQPPFTVIRDQHKTIRQRYLDRIRTSVGGNQL